MKNSKTLFKNLLIVGLTLGTTWAVRGQFGHEQGAAWAGGVAALCILAIAQREDWNAKLFKATLAAAFGWGLGGMMSYGIVVGYGNGVDFINVYYGLTMLFVIGGLYGFIGGGLFGLVLSNSKEKPVDWLLLIAKMVTCALVVYFFVIAQWGWKMTPPRSELWAACLGMGLALTWHLIQENQWSALRVAVYAGLGGGFGFAFGNFLQVLGKQSGIAFNFWNVMEYSLGFFGGLGMAYGTFTSDWPKTNTSEKLSHHFVPFFFLTVFIPLVIWKESFTSKRLGGIYEDLDLASFAGPIQIAVLVVMLLYAVANAWYFFHQKKGQFTAFTAKDTSLFFKGHFLFYILLSLLITGAFFSTYRIEQYLYLANYVVILLLLSKTTPTFEAKEVKPADWGKILLIALGIIAICALIAMNTHEAFEGMHRRFEI